MNESDYLASPERFVEHLRQLHASRRELKETSRPNRPVRRQLSAEERATILSKTAGRCHVCGGPIAESGWNADHILAHSVGGTHSVDNYLPAHRLCNSYRWDYSAEEFQQILKLGVWARTQVEHRTPVGSKIADDFLTYERGRIARKVPAPPASVAPDQ